MLGTTCKAAFITWAHDAQGSIRQNVRECSGMLENVLDVCLLGVGGLVPELATGLERKAMPLFFFLNVFCLYLFSYFPFFLLESQI